MFHLTTHPPPTIPRGWQLTAPGFLPASFRPGQAEMTHAQFNLLGHTCLLSCQQTSHGNHDLAGLAKLEGRHYPRGSPIVYGGPERRLGPPGLCCLPGEETEMYQGTAYVLSL